MPYIRMLTKILTTISNKGMYAVVAFFLIISVSGCSGKVENEYYISPDGRFENAGTEDAPWSLAKANSDLLPGETAILIDGTYTVTPIAPAHSGEAGAYIVYRAKNKHRAVFQHINDMPDAHGPVAVFVNNRSYISVEGIKVTGVKRWIIGVKSHHISIDNNYFMNGSGWINCRFDEIGDGMSITNNYFHGGTDLLSLDGGSGHLVEGNFFGDASHTGLVLLGVQNSVVRSNTLTNRQWRCMEVESQRHEPFRLSKYNLIENNYFDFSPARSIQYAGNNSIIRRNIFRHSLSGMVWSNYLGRAKTPEAWHNEHNRFYNNVVAECGSNDIVLKLIEENKTKGIDVAENVSSNGFGMAYLTNLFKPSVKGYTNVAYGDNVVVNNIFYLNANVRHKKASANAQIVFDWNATPEFGRVFNNNIYSGEVEAEAFYFTDAGLWNPSHKSNATIQEFEQQYAEWAQHNLDIQPQFVNPEIGNYQLKAESICIDKGMALTQTVSAGQGKVIPVRDALYFTNGYGLVDGDVIRINSQRLTIVSIDYDSNKITVSSELSWEKGGEVFLNYEGEAPDLGAFESGINTKIGTNTMLKP